MNYPETNLSRRDFLAAALNATLGVCSVAALNPHGAQAAEAPARGAKVRFGFTAYEWGKDWDLPTLIANLQKAQVFGVELRTSAAYAYGVEPSLSAQRRREVRKRFAGSPITLLGVASGERMDWPEPEKPKGAIEATKAHVKLSHDVGGSGVRVFPNQWHPNVPHQMNWDGWGLLEMSEPVSDRVRAIIEFRQLWEQMVAKAVRGL
ncbi:MAG TPA: twin-arginine translocation signal domain-containing protein [Dongiaceae bacterium]|nr:twin-arginine translocation signal domain-containing protein [Dongiaceae bacterium]